MTPALLIAISFVAGYFIAKDIGRNHQTEAYRQGYEQALQDVGDTEDELATAIREQAQLN